MKKPYVNFKILSIFLDIYILKPLNHENFKILSIFLDILNHGLKKYLYLHVYLVNESLDAQFLEAKNSSFLFTWQNSH